MKKDANGLICDPHDPKRQCRQWVRFTADGSVASVHEIAAGQLPPFAEAVEVTDLAPAAFHGVRVDPLLLKDAIALPPLVTVNVVAPETPQRIALAAVTAAMRVQLAGKR
jgi:hypothetical protein